MTALASLWQHFQTLPTWLRVLAWIFVWAFLLPLWILSGPRARWRTISAIGSFVVLGFVWSAVCAGMVTGATGGGTDDGSPSHVRETTATSTTTSTVVSTSETPALTATAETTPEVTPTQSVNVPASVEQRTPSPSPTSTPRATEAATTWSVIRIIDGDTVEVQSSDGSIETVRIVGIDTPEQGQCGFAEAADALARLVIDQEVDLVPGAQDDRDRYGRILRYIDVGSVDAGLELIRGGFAIARYDSRDGYGRHPRETQYVEADANALSICDEMVAPVPTPIATPQAPPPQPTILPFVPPPPPAEPTPPPSGGTVQTFPNCDALNVVYPGGVARAGTAGNSVSGELRPFGIQPVFDDVLYQANQGRDGDGDGIACEQ